MTIILILIIMGIILIAASFAFAPAPAAPQKPQPSGGEIKLPDGYIVIAPPPKPATPPKKPEDSWVYVAWNIVMGIVFILVLLSLLIMR